MVAILISLRPPGLQRLHPVSMVAVLISLRPPGLQRLHPVSMVAMLISLRPPGLQRLHPVSMVAMLISSRTPGLQRLRPCQTLTGDHAVVIVPSPVLQSQDACESPELAFQLPDVQTFEAADDNSPFSRQDLPCIEEILQSFLGDTLLAARISGSDIVFIGSVEDWQTMLETLGNDALLAIRPVTLEALNGSTVSELPPLRDNDPHALMHWTDQAPTEVTYAIMVWLEILQFTTESRMSGAVTINHGDFTLENAEHVLMNGTEIDTCLIKVIHYVADSREMHAEAGA